MIHYALTQYGFEYGAARVVRIHHSNGAVVINVETDKREVTIWVTRTGLIRLSGPIKKEKNK